MAINYRSVYLDLKKQIIAWYLDNLNEFQRSNACREEFREYIYDKNGNYLVGGQAVSDFIDHVERLFE